MKVKLLKAFGYLVRETFVIIYWIGIWSLLHPLHSTYVGFQVVCLFVGAAGLFVSTALGPKLILASIDESANSAHMVTVDPIRRFVLT